MAFDSVCSLPCLASALVTVVSRVVYNGQFCAAACAYIISLVKDL